MTSSDRWQDVFDGINPNRILEREVAAVQIKSHSFQEHEAAEFFAGWMRDLGFDVEMMEVSHPTDPGQRTRQPIGRLTGTGGGPTLMFNGHLDTIGIMSGWTVDPYSAAVRDGWIYGLGAHDDKGGLVAALSGIEAIVRAGIKLKGDILFGAVAAHKLGGVGTRAWLDAGVQADACINIEHSANTVATAVVGVVAVKIVTRNAGLFFRFSEETRAAYLNAIEQMALIVQRLGPSLSPHQRGSWLTFEPHPDLPGFPMHRFDEISKEKYPRECALVMEIRTVPGQTDEGLRVDLVRVLEGLKMEHPNLDYAIHLPAGGPEDTFHMAPSEIARDHPLVQALIEAQRLASGHEPLLGGALRIGNVGDGNLIAAAGIPSVQYGPGDIRIYPEWPAPDERVELAQLVETSRAMARAAYRYCG